MKKFLTQSIPPARLMLYLIVLSFLPLCVVGYSHVKQKRQWAHVQEHIATVRQASLIKAQKQLVNNLVRKAFENASSLYIDQRLETLTFLNKEKEALEALFSGKSFIGNEAMQARHAFITAGTNRLLFAEKGVQTAEGVRETVEVLTHPVEIDTEDLKTLLSLIEEPQPNQPQLIITDLKLTKNKKPSGCEVFDLNLSLLKREFIAS